LSVSKPPERAETQEPKPKPPRRTWWRLVAAFCPLPLQIAILVFVLAWIFTLVRGAQTINIGADDALDMLYLEPIRGGFFVSEERQPNPDFPQADNDYRWAGRNSTLRLPYPLTAVPQKMIVRLSAPRPNVPANETSAVVRVQGKLEWLEQDIGTIFANGTYDGNFYEFSLPAQLPTLASYEVRFDTDSAFQPGGGDVRGLALLFFSVRLEPDYARFGIKSWLSSFARPAVLAFITLCCWGIGAIFWRRRVALLLQIGAGVALLGSVLFWSVAAEPLYTPWAFILLVGWVLAATAGRFARRAPGLPPAFVYAATLFLLFPVAQFAFGRLNLYTLNPASVVIGAFTGAILYAAAYSVRGENFEKAFTRGILLASLVSFLYNHYYVFETNLYRGADFKVYYGAMLRFEEGGALYNLREVESLPGAAARQPPGFSFLLYPIVKIFGEDTNSALLVWRIFVILMLIPCVWLLLKTFGGVRDGIKLNPAIWFAVLNFEQIAESVGYGQWNIFVLFSLALMAYCLKRDKPGAAGAALSFAVWLKLYPVVSALQFVTDNAKNALRGIIGLILGGFALAGLISATVGFETVWFYVTRVVWGVNRPELDISNQSLWGFWARLALPRTMADYKGEFPAWVTLLSYACSAGLTLFTMYVLWARRQNRDMESVLLKVGALALLAVLIPPFVWFHYIVPCLVAIGALFIALTRTDRTTPGWQLLLFALAYGAVAYGGRNDFFFTDAVGFARFASSYRFIATFGLWALTLWLIWKNPKSLVASP
jgi:hypothetical protein